MAPGPGSRISKSRASRTFSFQLPGSRSTQQDSGASERLRRYHAQEIREDAVHQFEVGRERGALLVPSEDDLLGEALAVDGPAARAVDEIELRGQGVGASLLELGAAHQPGPVEVVADVTVAARKPGALLRGEAEPAADDQRLLELLAQLSPVLLVLEELVLLQVDPLLPGDFPVADRDRLGRHVVELFGEPAGFERRVGEQG